MRLPLRSVSAGLAGLILLMLAAPLPLSTAASLGLSCVLSLALLAAVHYLLQTPCSVPESHR